MLITGSIVCTLLVLNRQWHFKNLFLAIMDSELFCFKWCSSIIKDFILSLSPGTQVLANFWAINHDETTWDNPSQFRPERFLNDNGQLRNMKDFPHFMPFSTGRRACLGKNIGKSGIIVLSACLLQKLNIAVPTGEGAQQPTLEPEVHFDLVPKQYDIVVTRRDSMHS